MAKSKRSALTQPTKSKLTLKQKLSEEGMERIPKQSIDQESLRSLLIVLITLFDLNLSRIICIIALQPLFGSIASNYNFKFGVQFIDFLIVPSIYLLSSANFSPSPTMSNFLTAFLAWRAPDSFGRILSSYSSQFDILYAPFLFQFMAYWPIRLGGMLAMYQLTMKLLKRIQLFQSNPFVNKFSIVSVSFLLHTISWMILPLAQKGFHSIPPSQIFNLTPIILLANTLIVAILEKTQVKFKKTIIIKKINFVIFLGCILSAIYMPLPKNLSHEPNLNQNLTNHQPSDYKLLARRLSLTGLIIVGEFTQKSGDRFRFLRCDHSLLGGIWNGVAERNIQTQNLNQITPDELETRSIDEAEAIYPTFIIQTAVRLTERSSNTSSKSKALILGLGTGISARLLMKSNVIIKIVEIDPIIYEYCKTYFGLKTPNGGIYLEDARLYLTRNDETKLETFDYIIHDVFTGGSVPSSLFTVECWKDIHSKLKFDGILAVNFVGIPSSDPAFMVLTTLLHVFPFCRAFSENSGQVISETEYQNMIIFCSPIGKPKFKKINEIKKEIKFELSEYQIKILNDFEKNEIHLDNILALNKNKNHGILFDKDKFKLDLAQIDISFYHWKIMRSSLPDHIWNSYYF